MITITKTIIIAISTIIIIAILSMRTKCANIHPQSVGNEQLIPLANVSWRFALPKIQLSTLSVEYQAAIINAMTVRHGEILSWWLC
jgi:hypothetical protein